MTEYCIKRNELGYMYILVITLLNMNVQTLSEPALNYFDSRYASYNTLNDLIVDVEQAACLETCILLFYAVLTYSYLQTVKLMRNNSKFQSLIISQNLLL